MLSCLSFRNVVLLIASVELVSGSILIGGPCYRNEPAYGPYASCTLVDRIDPGGECPQLAEYPFGASPCGCVRQGGRYRLSFSGNNENGSSELGNITAVCSQVSCCEVHTFSMVPRLCRWCPPILVQQCILGEWEDAGYSTLFGATGDLCPSSS